MGWLAVTVSMSLVTMAILLMVKNISERKNLKKYMEGMEKSKDSLVNMINEGEKIIDELNKFSDHMATRIDIKNREIWTNMKKLDNKISDSEKRIRLMKVEANKIQAGLNETVVRSKVNARRNLGEDNESRVLPVEVRYRKVLMMAKNGYSDTEIAKELSMGKGEIRMVLKLRK